MAVRYAILLVLAIGVSAEAKRTPVETWGKAKVSFSDYRRDGVECATTGYFRDISQDEPAKAFVRGFQSYDNALNMPTANNIGGGPASISQTRDSVLLMNPDRRLKEIQAIQTSDVEHCLIQRGYAKFALSDKEEKTLKRYPLGSDARRQFLYQLATAERPQ